MESVTISDQLVRLYITMHGVYENAARAVDLTPQQAEILCRVANSNYSLSELAAVTNTSPKNMTGLVDRLEDRGELVRVADPTDRRVSRLELTKQGTRSFKRFDSELRDLLTRADLPTDADALDLLESITRSVDATLQDSNTN